MHKYKVILFKFPNTVYNIKIQICCNMKFNKILNTKFKIENIFTDDNYLTVVYPLTENAWIVN